MIDKFGTVFLGTTATLAVVSIQLSAQAAKLTGTFDWKVQPPKTEIFMGTGSFMINKDKNTGQLKFTVSAVPAPNPSPIAKPKSVFMFDILKADIKEEGKNWILNSFDFVAPKNSPLGNSSGSLNFAMPNNTDAKGDATEPFKSFFLQADGEKIPLVISNSQTTHVPEPTSTLSLLALSTLGASSVLKRKQK